MIFRRPVLTALVAAMASAILPHLVQAAEPSATDAAMTSRIEAMIPKVEAYSTSGMEAFDVPGLAIGIVVGDKLVYAKGFGVRSKSGGQPVDTRTIFQIGSNTKAFLAMSIAIMVDRGKLKWDDRVVDLYPDFQMKDPWVTREFRVFDLLAQRSGLPGLVNDMLAMLGFDETALIRSLRTVDPISSFRTTFAYTNITHLLASRIVADAAGASGWNDVLQGDLLDPLGMKDSTWTVEAIEGAANHANGHRWTLEGTVEVPFTPIFPYHFGRGRQHQLQHRGHGAVGPVAARQRLVRRTPDRLAGEPRRHPHGAGRAQRQAVLRHGLVQFRDRERHHRLARRRRAELRLVRRPRAEPKRRRHHPDERNQCRLSLGAWDVDSRPDAGQPGRRLRCHQDRRRRRRISRRLPPGSPRRRARDRFRRSPRLPAPSSARALARRPWWWTAMR